MATIPILSIMIVVGRLVIVSHLSPPGPCCYMCHRVMLRASDTIYFLSLLLPHTHSLSLSLPLPPFLFRPLSLYPSH